MFFLVINSILFCFYKLLARDFINTMSNYYIDINIVPYENFSLSGTRIRIFSSRFLVFILKLIYSLGVSICVSLQVYYSNMLFCQLQMQIIKMINTSFFSYFFLIAGIIQIVCCTTDIYVQYSSVREKILHIFQFRPNHQIISMIKAGR